MSDFFLQPQERRNDSVRSINVIVSRFRSNPKLPPGGCPVSVLGGVRTPQTHPEQPALASPAGSSGLSSVPPEVLSDLSPSLTLTMSTSEMLSRLSTWTSTPTGIAGPGGRKLKVDKV